MCPPCKVLVNGGFAAYSQAHERILLMARGETLKPEAADELLDRMRAIETEAYLRMRDEVTQPLIDKGVLHEDHLKAMWA